MSRGHGQSQLVLLGKTDLAQLSARMSVRLRPRILLPLSDANEMMKRVKFGFK